ncbi:MAG TPA: sugar phosphate isomerase/epimerase family protein [Candidatus Binatia bacterium]|nr:sugar phosphate isomerase/epimerase family protein [Candidatus Binatia bacterium]
MIHPRLSVSQASSIAWPIEKDLELWAATGIRDVALLLRKIDEAAGRIGGRAAAVRMLADAGLRVDNLAIGPCFELARPAQWEEGRDRIRASLAVARALGSRCVVITTGGPGGLGWDEAADALAAAIAPVVEEARRDGFELAVENTNGLRYDISFATTLRDTVDLARRIGLGVCMEVNNVWCERGLERTIAANADLFRMVQVNDFVVGTFQTPDRAVPGDGDIPLRRILAALRDAGYRGFFELEIVGPRIEAEGYARAIPRSLEFLAGVLRDLGIA